MNVHSIKVQAVVCNTAGTKTSIFGQARNDSGVKAHDDEAPGNRGFVIS